MFEFIFSVRRIFAGMANDSSSAIHWLRTSLEAFPQMLSAIDRAQQSVRLEMYIFASSPLGERFRDALLRARRRGLAVRVLIDAFGSISLSKSFWESLVQAGGEFRWFNPLSLNRLAYRDHRKILVCDERVAFVGGFNLAPQYEGDGVKAGWRDVGLQIQGVLARELAKSFDEQFARAEFRHGRFARLRRRALQQRIRTPDGDLFLSGPGRGVNPMKRALVQDLAGAKTVRIISAYFLPSLRVRRELARVVRRGGQAQLILAGRSDVPLAQLASQRLYANLLRAGVEIHLYQPQILHAKLFILDHIVYAGSANLDTRSLNINYELLVRLPNERLAYEATAIFNEDLSHSRRIDPVAWRTSRSFWQKLKESWAYFLLARADPYVARRQLRWLN